MNRTKAPFLAFILASLPLAACDILETEAPGTIADDDLNDRNAIPGIVVGISYDLAGAMDGINDFIALASGELWHGGSYAWADIPRGIILDEDVNGEWGTMHQARWVAEEGIRRIETILEPDEFASSPFVARAHLLAGLANRTLGENLCFTAIDGGPREPHTVHFERAIPQFDRAIAIGEAAGSGATDIVTAAYGGRASVKAWLGDWAGAAADAARVPVSFLYVAFLSPDGTDNTLAYETHDRFEYTVFDTEWVDHPDDPRAPWEIIYRADGTVARGANGNTPHYQQKKYTNSGDDIPLVKGTEMLVLRAEAALRANDIAGAFELLNDARVEYGMAALATPASIAEAWDILHVERGATTWLENRRFWDLRRWFDETGPAHHDFLADRDRCIPISEEELDTNPDARG